MKITIIYDNESVLAGLQADWGFSCLVEIDGRRLLFDTGDQGPLLLRNLEVLNLDPRSFSEIFISHGHHDHMGGLADLLRLNPDAQVYLPWSCSSPPEARHVKKIQSSCALTENLFSTGELPGGEQSLAIKTQRGLTVVVGCSHPGVGAILEAASRFGRVSALIGGLHGFKEYHVLADLELICPCHCTQNKLEILRRYPTTAIPCGAGKVLEID